MTRSAEAQQLSLGVLARSRKPNERRLPIHPAHFSRIDRRVRPRIFLEHGYGSDFGATDDALAELVGGIGTREQLIADCDVILLPKVQAEDLAELNAGQVVWGWPHCVQDAALTQIAIDRRLTLIAFEAMNHWQADGGFGLHVFHKNNELAGYCSVLHAMQLVGITGSYGRRLRAAVIGFGATARGAVTALNAHGVDDVRVLTNRDVAAVGSPIHSTQIVQMGPDPDTPDRIWADTPDGPDPGGPLPGRQRHRRQLRSPGSRRTPGLRHRGGAGRLHCRAASSSTSPVTWAWASAGRTRPRSPSRSSRWRTACTTTPSTTARPTCGTRRPGRSARRCCRTSKRFWPGRRRGIVTPTISRAIEIRDGVVLNPSILSFQHRDDGYPHPVRTDQLGALTSHSATVAGVS